jgi:superfamily II DNA or RNA helicase
MTDNNFKGLLYELYIRDHIIDTLKNDTYLWKDISESKLIHYGLFDSHNTSRIYRKDKMLNNYQDTGIDLIQIIDDKNIKLIQCKNGYNNGLTIKNLSGFLYWMVKTNLKYEGNIYYNSKLSINLKNLKNEKVKFIFKEIDNKNKKIIENNIIEYKPYNYQLDAFNKINEYFKFNNRCILNLPCGTGKTFTSFLISQNYKQIIFVSPLIEFSRQNLDRFVDYGYKYKTKIINSDNDRNITSINEFIDNNKKFLISTTYDSMDLINECMDKFDNPLFIIDEFHNISINNLSNKDDYIYKLLFSNHKILFLSATPRIYNLEDNFKYSLDYSIDSDIKNNSDNSDNSDDSDDENDNKDNIFGKIVYKMSINEAIKNKYICDYKIYIPFFEQDNKDFYNDINDEINYKIDDINKNKMIYLFISLINTNSKKTIIYCNEINEINEMIKIFKSLNEYFSLDVNIQSITSKNNYKERKEILNTFEYDNNNIQLLFSCRILDECIDIPLCDSIYITYPSNSKIRNIQRISRALRINKNNPNKIANIFVYCDEYDDITTFLSSIKEYDIDITQKVKINYYEHFDKKMDNKLIDKYDNLLNKYIIGIKEYNFNNWIEILNEIEYHYENKIKITNKKLKFWLCRQKLNFKNNLNIMKNLEIRNKFELFLNKYNLKITNTNNLSNNDKWNEQYDKLVNFINENNKLPSKDSKNEFEKKLGTFLGHQNTNYNKKMAIMKNNEEIYEKYKLFLEKYNHLFRSNTKIWEDHFEELKNYIDTNNKLPSVESKDPSIKKIGKFLDHSKQNYKKKTQIMKNEDIYNKFESFLEEYSDYFSSNEEKWINTYKLLIEYIDKNNEYPSPISNNYDIKKLGTFLKIQKENFKNKKNIMRTNEKVYNIFKEFLQKY